METFSVLIKKAKQFLQNKLSEKDSLSTGAKFWTYDDISLRLYIEISDGNDFTKLVKSGSATEQQCIEVWESIVSRNSKVTGNFDYLNFLDVYKQLAKLFSDYNIVRAYILKLAIQVDRVGIEYLSQFNINIDTTDKVKYSLSLEAASRRSSMFITKIRTKENQLKELIGTKSSDEASTVADIIAPLVLNGANVDENISLAMFNAINKTLSKRNGAEYSKAGHNI